MASDLVSNPTFRKTVGEVRKGDIVVHYRKPNVYAISVALENAKYSKTLPSNYGQGWKFRTDYCFLDEPIHRSRFGEKLAKYSEKYYAINTIGWVKQGYFLPFDIRGLKLIRAQIPSRSRPDWLKQL
jgi:hypothetical protein